MAAPCYCFTLQSLTTCITRPWFPGSCALLSFLYADTHSHSLSRLSNHQLQPSWGYGGGVGRLQFHISTLSSFDVFPSACPPIEGICHVEKEAASVLWRLRLTTNDRNRSVDKFQKSKMKLNVFWALFVSFAGCCCCCRFTLQHCKLKDNESRKCCNFECNSLKPPHGGFF